MLTEIHQQLEQLARFSSTDGPGVTRVLYSQVDQDARNYLKQFCLQRGLEVREDTIGNTFARWVGKKPQLPAVGTGSHIDAIPESGKYDGTVGVLGGLHAIILLQEQGFLPDRSIELLLFNAEEPTRFGIGCLGSRVISGQLPAASVTQLKDQEGVRFDKWRSKAGFSGDIYSCQLSKDYYHAFVELHIEQGPILEAIEKDIGVVTKIAAPSSFSIQLTGEGGHAGCVLMPDRKDAGCAAAEIVLAVEEIAQLSTSPDTVATCGIVKLEPSAVNSIPKAAYLEVDLRDTQVATRDQVLKEIEHRVVEICRKRNVAFDFKMLNRDPPAACHQSIIDRIRLNSDALGYSHQLMISRAYHDSLFMAQLCPTAMIFIPSRGGVSHRPDEYSSPEQIEKGVRVLAATLKDLSDANTVIS